MAGGAVPQDCAYWNHDTETCLANWERRSFENSFDSASISWMGLYDPVSNDVLPLLHTGITRDPEYASGIRSASKHACIECLSKKLSDFRSCDMKVELIAAMSVLAHGEDGALLREESVVEAMTF
eukprot:6465802-Amphidinium_carterae.2